MIISASRRTDIPAWYPKWFMERLRAGYLLVPSPVDPRKVSKIVLSPDSTDCIVFWTKDPEPMLSFLPEIKRMGYRFYFEFTLTPYDKSVEPFVPDKEHLIDIFKRLSDSEGPLSVDWRYDPIFINDDVSFSYHFEKFDFLCRELSKYTGRCIISFIDCYRKLGKRFRSLTKEEICYIAEKISGIASSYDLPVYACCEKEDLAEYGIMPCSCIDKEKIEKITGTALKVKKDRSQRKNCGCMESVDIGVYDTCGYGCRYCYACSGKRAKVSQISSPAMTEIPEGAEIIERKIKSFKEGPSLFRQYPGSLL